MMQTDFALAKVIADARGRNVELVVMRAAADAVEAAAPKRKGRDSPSRASNLREKCCRPVLP